MMRTEAPDESGKSQAEIGPKVPVAGIWLWVALCSILTFVVAPAGCMFALLNAAASWQADQTINCLTGAVVGIPIGFFFGLLLMIAGIMIHRSRDRDSRRNALLFGLISSGLYLVYITPAFVTSMKVELAGSIGFILIHHGLIALLLLTLYLYYRTQNSMVGVSKVVN